MQKPQKRRKGIIDFERLMDLPGFEKYDDFKEATMGGKGSAGRRSWQRRQYAGIDRLRPKYRCY
jgi:hypothetical protein